MFCITHSKSDWRKRHFREKNCRLSVRLILSLLLNGFSGRCAAFGQNGGGFGITVLQCNRNNSLPNWAAVATNLPNRRRLTAQNRIHQPISLQAAFDFRHHLPPHIAKRSFLSNFLSNCVCECGLSNAGSRNTQTDGETQCDF